MYIHWFSSQSPPLTAVFWHAEPITLFETSRGMEHQCRESNLGDILYKRGQQALQYLETVLARPTSDITKAYLPVLGFDPEIAGNRMLLICWD